LLHQATVASLLPLMPGGITVATIKFSDPIRGTQFMLDFAELVTLIKGSSIKSMAIGDDFFELGLSDSFNLRIQGQPDISLISTLNKGERPPVKLRIIAQGKTPTAEDVEKRIYSLRQLYAIAFLVNAGRTKEYAILRINLSANFEARLNKKDRLFITAASEGSFWITVLAKTGAAFKSLSSILPLFYDEGRQALLERMRATTDLKKLDVQQKEIKVASNFVDLIGKIDKIKDPEMRTRVQQALSANMSALGKRPLALPKPEGRKKINK
jgi:hypothetical protein